MNIKKLITIQIEDENRTLGSICEEIDLEIPKEQLVQAFLSDKGEKIFLLNINRIVRLLEQTPDEMYKKISKKSLLLIINWFETWIKKLEDISCQQ